MSSRVFKMLAVTTALSTGIVMTPAQQMVQAAAKAPTQYSTNIVLNQKTLNEPHAFVMNNTTYMPLYYVQSVLQALGLQTKWNGKSWDITGSGFSAGNLFIKSKSGTTNITWNGKLVEQNIPSTVAVDPTSGKATTYLPIWYVQQLLNAFGVSNTWNAAEKTWSLSYHQKLIMVSDIGYGSDGTLYAFAPDGVYEYHNTGWALVSGSNSIGPIKDGEIKSDGSIIAIGENDDLWKFTNGSWTKLDDPQLDKNSMVIDYNKDASVPLTIAGTVNGNGDVILQYINQQWQIEGISAGSQNVPYFLITKPDGNIIYETLNDGIWASANGQWNELPWFTNDTSQRCYWLSLSPDGELTGTTSGVLGSIGSTQSQVWQLVNGSWSPIGPSLNDHLVYVSWENGTMGAVGLTGIWQYVNGNWSQITTIPSFSYQAMDSDSKGDYAFLLDNGAFSAWNNGSWTTLSSQIIANTNG